MLKYFRWPLVVTFVGLTGAYFYAGFDGLMVASILVVLEVSLSFDNAVVNASVLERMNAFWQKMFLTVGILIAVFGMRLLFPFIVVGVTAQLYPAEALRLALEKGDPEVVGTYGYLLHAAHPSIAAFGGMFLLMLFLSFVFEEREITWLTWVEAPLARIGAIGQLPTVIAIGTLLVVATVIAENAAAVMISGSIGVVAYLLVTGLGDIFSHRAEATTGAVRTRKLAGTAALFTFLYLEMLDASFSFDGVIGAFAITSDPIVIAIGLGVGAMYIRSLTVYLVHKGTLAEYVYLEHGAHWAIGTLAVILLITIRYPVPDVVTGLVGIVFILAGAISSVARNRRIAALLSAA